MSEQRDDTTEQDESSSGASEPRPGSYYYDDATGYELYDPADDENEAEQSAPPHDEETRDNQETRNDAREAMNDER
jgi:hypothetical protein